MDQSIQSGGGGRSLFYILKFINQEIFRPVVILPAEKGVLTDRIQDEKVCELISEPSLHSSNKISRTPGKTRNEENIIQRLLSRIRNYADIFYLGFFKIPKLISQHRIDILYSNNDTTRLLSWIAGSLTQTPVVWHMRNVSKSWFWSILARQSIIKKTVFISQAQQSLFQVPDYKSTIIYNGIDTQEFRMNGITKKLRQEFNVSSAAIILGVTGRLLPKKGYVSFLKAGKLAIDRCRDKQIKLVIIGGAFSRNQENYLLQLKKQAEELDIVNHVVFTGFQKDIKSYVTDLDILVVPSIWDEPFGRTALEGMALGLPVIATRVGGLPEVIEDGSSGLLFEKNDIEAMAQAMVRLIRSPDLRQQMGLRGRSLAETKFNIDSRTAEIESTLSKMTEPAL